MDENYIINKHSVINVYKEKGVILSSVNSQILHNGGGNFNIHSTGNMTIDADGVLTVSADINSQSDIVLGNNDNVVKYFYFENNSNTSKHWRVWVNTNGIMNFEKYNGTTWVNKMNLE
jgi:hypothetical protein